MKILLKRELPSQENFLFHLIMWGSLQNTDTRLLSLEAVLYTKHQQITANLSNFTKFQEKLFGTDNG